MIFVTADDLFHMIHLFSQVFQKVNKITENKGSDGFFDFVGTMPHVLGTSSVNYILFLFIPIAGMAFDVCWKVFSNMFYPTQTQIHVELESIELANKKEILGEGNKKTNQRNDAWRT